jgi:hypothetical protein
MAALFNLQPEANRIQRKPAERTQPHAAQATCPHEHTLLNTTGSMHYSGGEVDDDLEDHIICQDCLAELTDLKEIKR